MSAGFVFGTTAETLKEWLIDPLDPEMFRLEVTEKLPQG
jgi:hypothetical protein